MQYQNYSKYTSYLFIYRVLTGFYANLKNNSIDLFIKIDNVILCKPYFQNPQVVNIKH